MGGWMVSWWLDGWMSGWMDSEWVDEWMDGEWVDGRMGGFSACGPCTPWCVTHHEKE